MPLAREKIAQTSMGAANLAQWKPRELVLSALGNTLEEFRTGCEASYLLCVRVDDPNSELAQSLTNHEQRELGRDGLGFRTVQRNVSSVVESLAELERSAKRVRTDRTPLARDVVDSPRYVLPLRKRSEAAFLKSISVGRARNHDVVLRHRSVSKFHAAFDVDDSGRLSLRDANSSNHTFVNGEKLGATPRDLNAGDRLQFGSVDCYLCTVEDLWRTVRG